MNKILIIEDDKNLNEGISMTLEGPETRTSAETVAQAKEALKTEPPDLILLGCESAGTGMVLIFAGRSGRARMCPLFF